MPDLSNVLPIITGAGGILATATGEFLRLSRQVPREESVEWTETCKMQRQLLELIARVRWDEEKPPAAVRADPELVSSFVGEPDPNEGVDDLYTALHSSGMRQALLPIRQGARGVWSCERAVRSYRQRLKKRRQLGYGGRLILTWRERRHLARARSRLIAISYVEPAATKAPRTRSRPSPR